MVARRAFVQKVAGSRQVGAGKNSDARGANGAPGVKDACGAKDASGRRRKRRKRRTCYSQIITKTLKNGVPRYAFPSPLGRAYTYVESG